MIRWQCRICRKYFGNHIFGFYRLTKHFILCHDYAWELVAEIVESVRRRKWRCMLCGRLFSNNFLGIYRMGKHILMVHLGIWKTTIKMVDTKKIKNGRA